jgi:hypothetical protein
LGFHEEITEPRHEGYKIEEKNYEMRRRFLITNDKIDP